MRTLPNRQQIPHETIHQAAFVPNGEESNHKVNHSPPKHDPCRTLLLRRGRGVGVRGPSPRT